MSTQPVPTFPAVAGFENYFGMTVEEAIEEKAKTLTDGVIELSKEVFQLEDRKTLSLESLKYYLSEKSLTSEKIVEFVHALDVYQIDETNDLMKRIAANSLVSTLTF